MSPQELAEDFHKILLRILRRSLTLILSPAYLKIKNDLQKLYQAELKGSCKGSKFVIKKLWKF